MSDPLRNIITETQHLHDRSTLAWLEQQAAEVARIIHVGGCTPGDYVRAMSEASPMQTNSQYFGALLSIFAHVALELRGLEALDTP